MGKQRTVRPFTTVSVIWSCVLSTLSWSALPQKVDCCENRQNCKKNWFNPFERGRAPERGSQVKFLFYWIILAHWIFVSWRVGRFLYSPDITRNTNKDQQKKALSTFCCVLFWPGKPLGCQTIPLCQQTSPCTFETWPKRNECKQEGPYFSGPWLSVKQSALISSVSASYSLRENCLTINL